MDFGQTKSVSGIRFEAAPADPRSARLLALGSAPSSFRLFLGCPVWGVKEWVGSVYPEGTPAKDFLREYARQFDSIELNSSFYRIPDVPTIEAWKRETPPSFRFFPKIHQDVTHQEDPALRAGALDACIERFASLGTRLGRAFLQLPPSFVPERMGLLESILERVPRDFPFAVEFRHGGWFHERRLLGRAFEALSKRDAATVITDTPGRRDASHSTLTSRSVIVRFLGHSLDESDFRRIDEWAATLARWKSEGLEEAAFFVHEPDNAQAPELLSYAAEKHGEALGLPVRSWADHRPLTLGL